MLEIVNSSPRSIPPSAAILRKLLTKKNMTIGEVRTQLSVLLGDSKNLREALERNALKLIMAV